jgi:hypothetical protein
MRKFSASPRLSCTALYVRTNSHPLPLADARFIFRTLVEFTKRVKMQPVLTAGYVEECSVRHQPTDRAIP